MKTNLQDNNQMIFYEKFLNEGIYLIKEKIQVVDDKEETIVHEPKIDYKKPSNQILMIFSYEKDILIAPKDELFLEKILEAINISRKDVEIFNIQMTGKKIEDLIKEENPTIICCFGLNQSQLPESTKDQDVTILENAKILSSPELSVIAADINLKRKLWANLKKIFDDIS